MKQFQRSQQKVCSRQAYEESAHTVPAQQPAHVRTNFKTRDHQQHHDCDQTTQTAQRQKIGEQFGGSMPVGGNLLGDVSGKPRIGHHL